MARPIILDHRGRPIDRTSLGQEIAVPTLSGLRSPITGYPGDGLNPVRLASILREADQGDPVRYMELAETVEERDHHYVGVLGTRRRSVSQLDITVEAGAETPEDEKIAGMVRSWVERDELADELFDMLDCISKGWSFTEVVYEISEGQYLPRLIHRDPRFFRPARDDLSTPMLVGDSGELVPLAPGRFIVAQIKAKSGQPLRSGLARVAMWSWLFKAYTQRDWAIFTQTYAQPLRLGKYGSGATEEDKKKLMQAVANIAGDCAAIVPESMMIEFVEAGNLGAGHQLYKERSDWLDQQVSKLVLGQTATTDAVTGGLGSGKEHREVQKDIEAADAKALAAILTQQLVRVWVQLEYGPRKHYPRIRIGRPEEEDLKALSEALGPMIDRGLEVAQADLRDRFGLAEPPKGARLMRPMGRSDSSGDPPTDPPDPVSKIKRVSGEIKRGEGLAGTEAAPHAEGPLAGLPAAPDAVALLTDRLALEADPAMAAMLDQIEAMFDAAGSLEELAAMVREGFPGLDAGALAQVLAQGFLAAHLAGRVEAQGEGDPA